MEKIYGVIDIGTLKVKTEIASVEQSGALRKLYSSNTLTCFGVGLDENDGFAQEQYVQQTLDELLRVRGEFQKHSVEKFRVVSTHAMRRAKNKDEILERVRQKVGFEVENISQAEEEKLFFRAVMQTFLPYDREYVVIDVGGGSVQVLVGTKKELRHSHMMETGTVSLHEKFVKNPHDLGSFTTEEDIENMKQEILKELMPLERSQKTPLIYGSSMIIDVMKKINIPLEFHEDSATHPYRTYAKHLEKIIEKVRPIPFGQRDKLYNLPHQYAWGLENAFLNAVTIAAHFDSPYIVPSNANVAQGIIYAMTESGGPIA